MYDLEGDIKFAIKIAKSQDPSREMSLVITKLQEALLWLQENKRVSKLKDNK
jgi:hypothetical protein